MITDIHAAIDTFLQQNSVISLVGNPDGFSPDSYLKAGVVPFIRHEGGYRFYVMKPQGRIPALGHPPFQLCKGTRMQLTPNGGWQDMRENSDEDTIKETLVQTALREGIEELGLKLPNIAGLYDLGPYEFASATTGKSKRMWLFAAKIVDSNDMLPDEAVVETTDERQWLSANEFAVVGREDHRYILDDMEIRLGSLLKE
jgi:hypothetical protein